MDPMFLLLPLRFKPSFFFLDSFWGFVQRICSLWVSSLPHLPNHALSPHLHLLAPTIDPSSRFTMIIAITIYPRGQQFPSFWILRPWVSLVFVTCLTELRTQPLFEITKESMSSKLLVRCIDLTDDVEELTQGRLQSPPNSLMNKFLSQSSFSFEPSSLMLLLLEFPSSAHEN